MHSLYVVLSQVSLPFFFFFTMWPIIYYHLKSWLQSSMFFANCYIHMTCIQFLRLILWGRLTYAKICSLRTVMYSSYVFLIQLSFHFLLNFIMFLINYYHQIQLPLMSPCGMSPLNLSHWMQSLHWLKGEMKLERVTAFTLAPSL